jgi:hypothetical protein
MDDDDEKRSYTTLTDALLSLETSVSQLRESLDDARARLSATPLPMQHARPRISAATWLQITFVAALVGSLVSCASGVVS